MTVVFIIVMTILVVVAFVALFKDPPAETVLFLAALGIIVVPILFAYHNRRQLRQPPVVDFDHVARTNARLQ